MLTTTATTTTKNGATAPLPPLVPTHLCMYVYRHRGSLPWAVRTILAESTAYAG